MLTVRPDEDETHRMMVLVRRTPMVKSTRGIVFNSEHIPP